MTILNILAGFLIASFNASLLVILIGARLYRRTDTEQSNRQTAGERAGAILNHDDRDAR